MYLNTPIRPPAESYVKTISNAKLKYAAEVLGGISIELLISQGFQSEIADHFAAILSIIKRHPMNQFEIGWFLKSRGCSDISKIFCDLENDEKVEIINYKGFNTFRLN